MNPRERYAVLRAALLAADMRRLTPAAAREYLASVLATIAADIRPLVVNALAERGVTP